MSDETSILLWNCVKDKINYIGIKYNSWQKYVIYNNNDFDIYRHFLRMKIVSDFYNASLF